jgi:hypothetical protein
MLIQDFAFISKVSNNRRLGVFTQTQIQIQSTRTIDCSFFEHVRKGWKAIVQFSLLELGPG